MIYEGGIFLLESSGSKYRLMVAVLFVASPLQGFWYVRAKPQFLKPDASCGIVRRVIRCYCAAVSTVGFVVCRKQWCRVAVCQCGRMSVGIVRSWSFGNPLVCYFHSLVKTTR